MVDVMVIAAGGDDVIGVGVGDVDVVGDGDVFEKSST